MKRTIAILFGILMTMPLFAGENRVLIAMENTGYKKALVRALVEELESGSIEIVVVNHQKGELEDVVASDYDAVFITNSGVRARVRPNILEWLDSTGNPENVILHTTQITDWEPDVSVDSITSASQRSNIGDLAVDIAGRIRQYF